MRQVAGSGSVDGSLGGITLISEHEQQPELAPRLISLLLLGLVARD